MQSKIDSMKTYLDNENVDADTKARLAEVLARTQELFDDTACTPEEVAELYACNDELDAIRDFIVNGPSEQSFGEKLKQIFMKILTDILRVFSDFLLATTGGKGASDILNAVPQN